VDSGQRASWQSWGHPYIYIIEENPTQKINPYPTKIAQALLKTGLSLYLSWKGRFRRK